MKNCQENNLYNFDRDSNRKICFQPGLVVKKVENHCPRALNMHWIMLTVD